MLYLSQLLNKNILYQGKSYGKILDLAVFPNKTLPSISKIEISRGKQKITIPPNVIRFEKGNIVLTTIDFPQLPYDHKDLYLAEDLLDKQVIDIDGRRLVRVNDVVLEDGHELKASGIDIGLDGILRRLGLTMLKVTPKVLPWHVIEAFDYDTGTIKIKLKQNSLAKLHPADIADILEDAGTKERLGIVESLDAKQAARAIEEADEETQVSILENLTPTALKNIINTMHIAELADVFHDINPVKIQEIQKVLGAEKIQRVKKLSSFSDSVAGGVMHENFFHEETTTNVKTLLQHLKEVSTIPEVVIVTKDSKFAGTIQIKDILSYDFSTQLEEIPAEKIFISPETDFTEIVRVFAQYNLRALPVVDSNKKIIGVVLVDEILKIIDEENERDENI